MNVQGIGNGVGQAGNLNNAQAQIRVRDKAKNEVQSENLGETTTQAPVEPQQEEKVKGVIRLLQEGHFKGVADVRLRINFNDELQAIEHDSLSQAAGEQAPALQDAVNSQIQGLLDSGGLNEDQTATVLDAQETFNTSVQQAVDDFTSAGGTDTESLKQGLQAAFDTLADSLSPLLTALTQSEEGVLGENAGPPIEPAAPGEGDATTTVLSAASTTELTASSTENAASPLASTVTTATSGVSLETTSSTEEPASGLSTFMDDLKGAFDAALEKLDGALQSARTMPELSQPTGNGKAYDKFLAMYNDLNGVTSAQPSTEEPQGLNTVA